MKTIFCDIDGTLIEQVENYIEYYLSGGKAKVLPGVYDKLKEWESKNYRLVLTTARKEGSRQITMKTLEELGIFYDQLVMGVGVGPRVLINDMKPGKETPMAESINLTRNKGLGDINV